MPPTRAQTNRLTATAGNNDHEDENLEHLQSSRMETTNQQDPRSMTLQLNFPNNISTNCIEQLSSATPNLIQKVFDGVLRCNDGSNGMQATPASAPLISRGNQIHNELHGFRDGGHGLGENSKLDVVNQIRAQIIAVDILHAYSVQDNAIDAFTKLVEGETLSKKDLRNLTSELRYASELRNKRSDIDCDTYSPEYRRKSIRKTRGNPRGSRFSSENHG